MPTKTDGEWPVLKTYENQFLRRIALPLGGIGTGTLCLGGRGNFHRFELVNRPALDFTPPNTFFALRTESKNGVFCRALEGPIAPEDFEGADGCRVPLAGLPRFQKARFGAAYPLGEVEFEDENCPLDVQLRAFNPFVVGDVKNSSWPVAVARWVLHNPTNEAVTASICGSFSNFLGGDGVQSGPHDKHNHFLETPDLRAVCASANLETDSPFFGSFALGLVGCDAQTTHRTAWKKGGWGNSILDFWDDFSHDGRLEERPRDGHSMPVGSLCARVVLEPLETRELTFVWAWHFPNRLSWTPDGRAQTPPDGVGCWCNAQGGEIVGNAYTQRFADAADVLRQFAPALPDLERQTLDFARAFYGSDLPMEIKEAAGFNLSTLRSPTLFQTRDGHFFGWEGVADKYGSCYGNCTHVWNYEQATPFLFPEIARDFRETEFFHASDDTGLMVFRVGQPLEKYARSGDLVAAADGQCGAILKVLREWKLGGDADWVRAIWPRVKQVLEFCWIENGWDGDRDGVMEGCQHNTMDVEYFGPNPQMQFLYLAALRAGAQISEFCGDTDFAHGCRDLAKNGAAWTLENLWNGDYFEHQIRPPLAAESIAPGLRLGWGSQEVTEPEYQLGAGCLIDQLFGVWLGQICGAGEVLEGDFARQTLQNVVRFNARERGAFNPLRSFVLGDEDAITMASFPRGERPIVPFPYYGEAMTGFEHYLAAHLLQLGERDAGLKVIRDIRGRYNGQNRNPFDEAECGRHYARAMASWGEVLAWSGFDFDARNGVFTLRASNENVRWFWSVGRAWGTVSQTPNAEKIAVEIAVLGGELAVQKVVLSDFGARDFGERRTFRAGQKLAFEI